MRIIKYNELYVRIMSDKDIAHDIYDRFSFYVPGYQHMPKYKKGRWDGQIHLFNLRTRLFPLGLLADLMRWAIEEKIELDLDKQLRLVSFKDELESWYPNALSNLELEPYQYQLDTFKKAINLNRSLVLSPTGSGKSFIIYLIIRFLLEYTEGKILISVPSINLVRQMHLEFCDYEKENCVCATLPMEY